MTKAEIVDRISRSAGVDRASVLAVMESFMEVVKDSLSQGENVYLRGFGSFEIRRRAEKKGRNISMNTTVVIPACKIPMFKPSEAFKRLLSE